MLISFFTFLPSFRSPPHHTSISLSLSFSSLFFSLFPLLPPFPSPLCTSLLCYSPQRNAHKHRTLVFFHIPTTSFFAFIYSIHLIYIHQSTSSIHPSDLLFPHHIYIHTPISPHDNSKHPIFCLLACFPALGQPNSNILHSTSTRSLDTLKKDFFSFVLTRLFSFFVLVLVLVLGPLPFVDSTSAKERKPRKIKKEKACPKQRLPPSPILIL